MKLKFWLIFSVLFFVFLSACTVTQEKYRYQRRFDNFYSLLTDQEKALFRDNRLEQLGKMIEEREKKEKDFGALLKKVKQYEAIATFDGKSTASFFRNTILRELNREHFYRLMNLLSEEEQVRFVKRDAFADVMKKKMQSSRSFKSWLSRARKNYRLIDFTPEQIFSYYREVSFNEVARRHFYLLLSVLKGAGALDYFLTGRLDEASQILNDSLANRISLKLRLKEMRKLSSLTAVSVRDLLRLYFEVVMPEMDPDVVQRTVGKFY